MENNSTNIIINTLNEIFNKLFNSLDNSIYETLDKLCFINTSIIKEDHFKYIFGTSPTNGILLIVNSLILGLILYYIIKYYIATITHQKTQNPFSFIFKLFIFGIAMNSSYFIVEQIIELFDLLSNSILTIGENFYSKSISFSNLINYINTKVTTNTIDTFSIDGIIKTTLSISLLNLTISYAYRYVLIKIMILLSPLAFLSLCTDSTSNFFKVWFKNFFGLMFIEIFAALILDILFSLDYTSLLSKLIYLGGIYCLIMASSITTSFFGNIGTSIQNSFSMIKK